jgi:hypothetical protein
MKNISKKTKIFAIVVLCIALLIGGFSLLDGSTPSAAPVGADGLDTTGVAALPTGGSGSVNDQSIDQFADLLSTIQSISIDTTIFQDPAYLSLRDHPIVLGSDVIGRVNPFVPVGTDSGAGTTTATVSVQTLAAGKITKNTAEFGALVTLGDTSPVTVIFEYGTSDAFGSATSPLTASHSGTTLSTATDLSPGTLYYVRAMVVKGSITTPGNTMTFTTAK